jgi:putative flavoprotein involved in K+ transport
MHSCEYRNPAQLRDGDVLIVGAGNSGADIALELARERKTWLSGRHPGHIPIRIETRRTRTIFPLLWFAWGHVLTIRTPIGRKVQGKVLSGGDPLIRVKPSDLDEAGVQRLPRTAGVEDGLPVLEDGRVMGVPNVIWCTGYRRDASWIDLPAVDRNGAAPPARGIVDGEPGLYFLGRVFQYSFRSHTVGGVGGDAEHIAREIERLAG